MTITQNTQQTHFHGRSHASWDGQVLHIDGGNIKRSWRDSGFGLVSQSLSTMSHKQAYEWLGTNEQQSDWSLPGFGRIVLEIEHVEIRTDTDDGFSSEHILVRIHYRHEQLSLIQDIRCWYNRGMRISFSMQGTAVDPQAPTFLEQLTLQNPVTESLLWGYYNDTQNRNTAATPILEELETQASEWHNDWASACALRYNNHALILVKESHKCVNQAGVDGGSFSLARHKFTIDGFGIPAAELQDDQALRSWATWYIPAANDKRALAAACREFDRTRFPCNIKTDAYVIANTWGSGHFGNPEPDKPGRPERRSARENVVLKEIESCGDLGIDVLQIDDGWQTPADDSPDPGAHGWHPHKQCWPQGWSSAVEAAETAQVTLGLWAPAQDISYDELVSNWQDGDFQQYKLDFAVFNSNTSLKKVIDKCRAFVSRTGHQTRVNWDVTENPPRFGYYYGRDLGAIFLANRKPDIPESTIYEPWLMLRDVWQMARYLPIKQFQISCQNPIHTDTRTEAHKHDISYGLAIACVGLPLCFHRTSLYTDEQRQSVRNWLRGYQAHKYNLHLSDCEPIGDAPSNASWTGFHYRLDEKRGYFLVFRELHNTECDYQMQIPGCEHTQLMLQDCHSGQQWQAQLGSDARLDLHSAEPARAQLIAYSRC